MVRGLDPLLDPHLQSIREQLKAGINSTELNDKLEKITQSVAQIKHEPALKRTVSTGLLFDFLLQHYKSSKQQAALQQLHKKTSTSIPEIPPNELFIDILKAIEPDQDSSLTSNINSYIDVNIISQHLLSFLDEIEIPSIYHHQTKVAKQLLADSNQSSSSFEDILDKSFKLLLKIKQHNQSEQQDIDDFLSHITEQLAALDIKVLGASSSAQESAENRIRLDQSVSEQMEELQLSSSNATKLEPLKVIINNRLANLTKEIRQTTQNEAIHRQKLQQQLDDLIIKIKDMETESSDLKTKLKIANTQALRDTLTGLPNRNAYNERMEIELARWKRYQTPLSLIIWDIDHFKIINDSYGHKAGDKVLRLIANQLSDHSRVTDFISRFGGEEFTMLLPNTKGKEALLFANQLRQAIEKAGFNSSGTSVKITISCGVTEFLKSDTDESAFDRADKALYEAKEQGRNRCCAL